MPFGNFFMTRLRCNNYMKQYSKNKVQTQPAPVQVFFPSDIWDVRLHRRSCPTHSPQTAKRMYQARGTGKPICLRAEWARACRHAADLSSWGPIAGLKLPRLRWFHTGTSYIPPWVSPFPSLTAGQTPAHAWCAERTPSKGRIFGHSSMSSLFLIFWNSQKKSLTYRGHYCS